LDLPVQSSAFTLKTSQRTLFVQENSSVQFEHAEYFHGLEAYLYLLETICGLKSRLVGENDIVNQFKEAYQSYMSSDEKSSLVIQILEKLFQDANLDQQDSQYKRLTQVPKLFLRYSQPIWPLLLLLLQRLSIKI
jgi:glutamyl-tRNA reductase